MRVVSCYAPGTTTPTLKDYDSNRNELLLPSCKDPKPQRVIPGKGFHGIPGLRQDCVLIQGSNESRREKSVLWIAKALALIRIKKQRTGNSEEQVGDGDYVFVQYFDTVRPQDCIDDKLNCVRLQWAKESPENSKTQSSADTQPRKWFDLLPASTIRGRAHVIRGDYGIQGLCATRNMEDVPWFRQFFYINRFYFEPAYQHRMKRNGTKS